MKKLIFTAVILVVSVAISKPKMEMNPQVLSFLETFVDGAKANECVNSAVLRYIIVGKVGPKDYELTNRISLPPNAVLHLSKGRLNGKGLLGDLQMKYIGSMQTPTKDGFTQLYDYWEACQ